MDGKGDGSSQKRKRRRLEGDVDSRASSAPPSPKSEDEDIGKKASGPASSIENLSFPVQLMQLINDNTIPEYVWWMENEEAICFKVDGFQEHVLDVYFQGLKYQSLIRKMNRWGFRRVTSSDDLPSGTVAFYHNSFRKNEQHLLKDMGIGKKNDSGSIRHNSVAESLSGLGAGGVAGLSGTAREVGAATEHSRNNEPGPLAYQPESGFSSLLRASLPSLHQNQPQQQQSQQLADYLMNSTSLQPSVLHGHQLYESLSGQFRMPEQQQQQHQVQDQSHQAQLARELAALQAARVFYGNNSAGNANGSLSLGANSLFRGAFSSTTSAPAVAGTLDGNRPQRTANNNAASANSEALMMMGANNNNPSQIMSSLALQTRLQQMGIPTPTLAFNNQTANQQSSMPPNSSFNVDQIQRLLQPSNLPHTAGTSADSHSSSSVNTNNIPSINNIGRHDDLSRLLQLLHQEEQLRRRRGGGGGSSNPGGGGVP